MYNDLNKLNLKQIPYLMKYVLLKDREGIIRLDKKIEEQIQYFIGNNSVNELYNYLNETDTHGTNLVIYLSCYLSPNSVNKFSKLMLSTVLKYDIDINCKDNEGNTILHILIDQARRPLNNTSNKINYEKDIITILLKNNYNILQKDSYYKKTPLELAKYHKLEYLQFFNIDKYERMDHIIEILETEQQKILSNNLQKLVISKLPLCEDLMLKVIKCI